jgi:LysM repeat protein
MGALARKLTLIAILVFGSMGVGAMFSYHKSPGSGDTILASERSQPTAPPTFIRASNQNTILSTMTPQPSPTATLLPPPTFEPPTATPTPSAVPSATLAPTTNVSVSIPGLRGAETPTPSSTPGCEPRTDWKLTYTVQFDDALSTIADRYGTWVDDLAEANCITDKNLIVVGQVLRVPGDVQPQQPEVECVPWEVLTPFNGSVTVPADGSITFNWRGPMAPINLIRIYRPDGSIYERVIELRQNETINLNDFLAPGGTYTWYVYPLGHDFRQVQFLEGGPWTFYKPLSSTPTPVPAANTGGSTGGQ